MPIVYSLYQRYHNNYRGFWSFVSSQLVGSLITTEHCGKVLLRRPKAKFHNYKIMLDGLKGYDWAFYKKMVTKYLFEQYGI